jgi:hypothetical protein
MATKTPKNKTSKKLTSSSPENVETKQVSLLGGFLPGKEVDLDEYLKDVPAPAAPKEKSVKKKAKAEAPAEVMSSSNEEFAGMTERAMRLAHAQEDSQDELAASPESLGLKKDAILTTKAGTYDYQTGRHFTAKAISSDLGHFTEFHRLHNMVSDALEKHSAIQKISTQGKPGPFDDVPGRTGPFDGVDIHLTRASRAITAAMEKHIDGENMSKEVGTNLGATVLPGSVTGFGNAITHLKNASKRLETLTNNEFKGIEGLATTLHAGYVHHVEDTTSGLALASDSQRELEERARTGDSDEKLSETRPPQTVAAPFKKMTRGPEVTVGNPREMFVANPSRVKPELKMDYASREDEPTPEEGRAAFTARINEQDAASRAELQGKISNWREKNRARVRSVLENPRFAERSAAQRGELSQRLATQETPFPQSEGRMAAFRKQQEGTYLTTGKEQRGTSVLDTSKDVIAQVHSEYHEKHSKIVQAHIDNGDIAEAAAYHFRTMSKPMTLKQDQKTISKIKNNPHRYLSENGFDTGAAPRTVQERSAAPGRTPERIRVKSQPATGSSGEIVSRAKLNNPRKIEFSQGSSPTTPFRPGAPEEYEAKLNEIQGR